MADTMADISPDNRSCPGRALPPSTRDLELVILMSPTSKVTRWFEMIQPAPLSRPESGFVDSPDGDDPHDSLLLINRLPSKKRRKLLGLRIGKNTLLGN
ncbi:unnamed protein product [Nesidiocoris tenuis]|uniref:Uncharacterized protein n=1 Tax=Nesidiocoris tenuis TaxID=355587 RepID=A0A6H5GJW1_9HEMI|nr:unnamed protein product [Nesidiocoris tenuis]